MTLLCVQQNFITCIFAAVKKAKFIFRMRKASIKVCLWPQFIEILEIKFQTARTLVKTFTYGTRQYARVNLEATAACAAIPVRRSVSHS